MAIFAIIFVLLPAAVYTGLCLLPRGRAAGLGIAGAALFAGIAWAGTLAMEEPSMARLPLAFASIGVALAAPVQALRAAIGRALPNWMYLTFAALVLVGALGLMPKLMYGA